MFVRLNNERGVALLVTLAVMAMITLVVVMSVDRSTTDIELSYNQLHEEQAFYVADAGLKRAVNELDNDENWRAGYTDYTFGQGSFTVAVWDLSDNPLLDDTVIILSVGVVGAAVSNLEITSAPVYFHPFKKAMFGDDIIDIKNSMDTDSYNSDSGSYAATRDTLSGDLGSNGDIKVFNGAYIGGDVVTSLTGGTDIDVGATITGTIADDAPEQELFTIPQAEFDWAESNNTADVAGGITGSYTYDPITNDFISGGSFELTGGIYFFSSIILQNNASLTIAPGAEVTIYVTGDIELKQASEVNPGGSPSDLTFYSQGDFLLMNSGDFYGTFYNPDGTVDLSNSGDFYGSIVANDILCNNSSKFHYDRNLSKIERDEIEEMVVVAWREVF